MDRDSILESVGNTLFIITLTYVSLKLVGALTWSWGYVLLPFLILIIGMVILALYKKITDG